MSEIRVRRAVESDAEAVFALLTQFAMSYTPVRARFDEHFPRLVQGEGADLLVAEGEGEVVGYVLACRMLTLYANGPILEIQELFVEAAQRGKGVGRRLVTAVLERAAELGCAEVTVPTRRAVDYYPKLGFEARGVYLKCRLAPGLPAEP